MRLRIAVLSLFAVGALGCIVAIEEVPGAGGASGSVGAGGEAGAGGSVGAGGEAGRGGAGDGGVGGEDGTGGSPGEGGAGGQAGEGGVGGSGGATGVGGSIVVVEELGPTPAELAAEAIGHYATRTQVTQTQSFHLLGDLVSVTVRFGLAEIHAAAEDRLEIVERPCRVEFLGTSQLSLTMSDATVRSNPSTTGSFRLFRQGKTLRFQRGLVAYGVGARLSSPLDEALPTDAADPRVFDQDGDGKPGITLSIDGPLRGDAYVVQRQKNAYTGAWSAEGSFGLVDDASEQSSVGASNSGLDQDMTSRPGDVAEETNIRFVPLAGAYDCDQLVAEKDALFVVE